MAIRIVRADTLAFPESSHEIDGSGDDCMSSGHLGRSPPCFCFQLEAALADAFFDVGEHTMVLGVLKGRGSHSGLEVAMPAIGVARWRDGLCISHKGYVDKSDALAELGVSEDTLEPIKP